MHGICDLAAVGAAELLAESCGSCGTYLYALAAGDALGRVHMCAISAAGHVGRVEELGCAQAVAAARGAVADADDPVRTVQVGDLMDIALALGALQDLHDLLFGHIFGIFAARDQELGDIADTDAHMSFNVADAFSADALCLAAGADHGAEGVILVEPMGEMFHTDRGRRGVNGLLYGNDVHADPGASGRHELGRQFQRLLGRQIEHSGNFRVFVGQCLVLNHVLAGSHDPLGHQILNVVVLIVAVLFQNTDPQQVIDDLLRFLLADAVAPGQLRCGETYAALLETEKEHDLTLCQKTVQDPEIHVVFVHAAGKLARDVVGDHPGQLHDQLFLDGIITAMILEGIVSFVSVYSRVNFFGHILTSLTGFTDS